MKKYKFFILTWSANEYYDQEYIYLPSRDITVESGKTRKVENAEAQLCSVELLPNDKVHTELRISSKGEVVKFDINVAEYDLLNELTYSGEFLIEVENESGDVISIYDTHKPPKIVEEGSKGNRYLRTSPYNSPNSPVGASGAYDKWGGKLDGYERVDDPQYNKLYEFVEELVNS